MKAILLFPKFLYCLGGVLDPELSRDCDGALMVLDPELSRDCKGAVKLLPKQLDTFCAAWRL